MLTHLFQAISNRRFITYVALLYVIALTAGSLISMDSGAYPYAGYLKIILLPLAQAFLLMGTQNRWPSQFKTIATASTAFYFGVIGSTQFHGFF